MPSYLTLTQSTGASLRAQPLTAISSTLFSQSLYFFPLPPSSRLLGRAQPMGDGWSASQRHPKPQGSDSPPAIPSQYLANEGTWSLAVLPRFLQAIFVACRAEERRCLYTREHKGYHFLLNVCFSDVILLSPRCCRGSFTTWLRACGFPSRASGPLQEKGQRMSFLEKHGKFSHRACWEAGGCSSEHRHGPPARGHPEGDTQKGTPRRGHSKRDTQKGVVPKMLPPSSESILG